VNSIAALHVEEKAVMLVHLGDRDDVFGLKNTQWEKSPMKPAGNLMSVRTLPSTNTLRSFKINMACTVNTSSLLTDLATSQSVLETVAKKDDQRKGLAQLVGSSSRASSLGQSIFFTMSYIGARKLVKHPVTGGIQPLQVLLGTTTHGS
jgi:hypothetical protein